MLDDTLSGGVAVALQYQELAQDLLRLMDHVTGFWIQAFMLRQSPSPTKMK